jgi:hypothetical protein
MDMKLDVAVVPVLDVDQAKRSSRKNRASVHGNLPSAAGPSEAI